jgi:hypothetical protein
MIHHRIDELVDRLQEDDFFLDAIDGLTRGCLAIANASAPPWAALPGGLSWLA